MPILLPVWTKLYFLGGNLLISAPRLKLNLPKKLITYAIISSSNCYGMYYADKRGKAWIQGVKIMRLVDKDVVLTTKEAIKYLKISKPTYLKYIRLGRIKAVKAGSGWRVHQSELYRFLKVLEKEIQM